MEAHTLSVAELAAHTHTVTCMSRGGTGPKTRGETHDEHTIDTSSTGSNQAHTHTLTGVTSSLSNNLPPYYTISYVMRIS